MSLYPPVRLGIFPKFSDFSGGRMEVGGEEMFGFGRVWTISGRETEFWEGILTSLSAQMFRGWGIGESGGKVRFF